MELKKKYKIKELQNIFKFLDSYTHNDVDKHCMMLALSEDIMKHFTKVNNKDFGSSYMTFVSTSKGFEYHLGLDFTSVLKVTDDFSSPLYLYQDNKVYVDSSIEDFRDPESLKNASKAYKEIKIYGMVLEMINYLNKNREGVLSVLDLAKHGYGGGTKKLVESSYDYENEFGKIDKPNDYMRSGAANSAYASMRGAVAVNLEKMHLEMMKPVATAANSVSSRIKL